MYLRSIGVSALKGGRHQPRESILLRADGPVGDRVFAVVDPSTSQVLRTVEHPSLLGCAAGWDSGVLSVEIAGKLLAAVPAASGRRLDLNYWGRAALMDVVDGPWAEQFSRLLGRSVLLARTVDTGSVVFGDCVSIATSGSLGRLSAEVGHAVDARRFRSTFTIDTGDDAAHEEDSWAGRYLELGGARLLIKGAIPRCAVIDLDPDTGARGTNLLKTLAGYRLRGGEVMFGVYAEVVSPGTVSVNDRARLLP